MSGTLIGSPWGPDAELEQRAGPVSYEAVIPSRASGEIVNSCPKSPHSPGPFPPPPPRPPKRDLWAYNSEVGLLLISQNPNIFLKQHQSSWLPAASPRAKDQQRRLLAGGLGTFWGATDFTPFPPWKRRATSALRWCVEAQVMPETKWAGRNSLGIQGNADVGQEGPLKR